jgi:serine/threonine-protein kinase HipA
MSWSRMHRAVWSLADRARCRAKDRLHSSENLDVKVCIGSEGAHLVTHSDVWPQSCLGTAKSAIGGDTAGALSIGRPGRTGTVQWRSVETPDELEALIEGLPSKPFLVGAEGVSMSLAGAQTKLAAAVDDGGRISIPMNGSPSTHILKPDVSQLCGNIYNEAFCLTLARRVDLSVPYVTTGLAGKRAYLLVERYDRRYQSGRWRRLHQEDYCQALGKPPSAKYESNQTGIDGPTLKEMFALTRRHMPPTEILRLLDRVIFNVLVCNTDAHAKNYSIMIAGNGIVLAPTYDVMCGEVWGTVTKNLVHKIGDSNRGEQLEAKHWQQFALECGLNPKQVLDRVSVLARPVIAEVAAVEFEVTAMPAGGHPILPQTRQTILDRAQALLKQVQAREGVAGGPSNIDTASPAQSCI